MLIRLALLVAVALGGCGYDPYAVVRPEGYAFPAGFLWGVAVAAHQVEGGNDRNDWWEWEQEPGRIRNGDKSGDAVAFTRTYAQDLGLARDLGARAFRFSLEWSRIEPERGRLDPEQIRYYRDVLAAVRAQGMRPFVTLLHFTLPTWVAAQGGWTNPATIEDFGRYASVCAREFGADVDDWITINEPNIYGFKAYDEGSWPPGVKDRPTAIRVMANQMIGHGRAAKALRRGDRAAVTGSGSPARIGVANHVVVIDPWSAISPLDQARAYFEDQVFNVAALDVARTGRFVATMPGSGQVEVADDDMRDSVDFIGINYYTRRLVSGMTETRKPEGSPYNDLDWEIYPDGLFRWLDRLRAYRLPVYITENGTADNDDRFRDRFIVQHLMRVWAAIDAGVPVEGYFHWSLMDNFEWAEGYHPRFGLYRVDFDRDRTSRTLTKGGEVFRQIARGNRIPAELVLAFGQGWISR